MYEMRDEALLAAAAAGDAEAFATFYRRHLALVVAFGLRCTGDPEATADLVGEVFATALSRCADYQPLHDTAAPWLVGIAHNKLRESRRRGRVQDEIRRRLQIRPLALADDDLRRVEELASIGDRTLSAALEQLPRSEREAVRGRIVDEREYHELATELQCSEAVVRQRVSRGLRRMRASVSHDHEGKAP
jgi:RNA polymerase sigma factor (sigma-70 family)